MSYTEYRGFRFNPNTLSGQIKKLVLDNPNMTAVECAERLNTEDETKVKERYYITRTELKRKGWKAKAPKKPVEEPKVETVNDSPPILFETSEPESGVSDPFKVRLSMPESGLEIKVDNGAGMIATLKVSHEGLAVLKANSKNQNPRQLTWRVLGALCEHGLE